MELAEIKEFLKTDEGKTVFSEIAKELNYESPEDVQGLKDKTRELLGKLKVTKTEKEKYDMLLGDTDEETLQKALDLAKKGLTTDGQPADAKYKRELEQLRQESEKYKVQFETVKSRMHSKTIESELQKSFLKNNIDPVHHSILTDALKSKLKIEESENGESVIYDDGLYGKPFDEYMNEFVRGNGQAYVRKPANSGAGSQNMTSNAGSSSTFSRKDLSDAGKQKEYYKAIKEGRSVTIVD